MKLAYVTTYDAGSLKGCNEWSGTGYYIAQSLKNQSIYIEYIGPLQDAITSRTIHKFKRHYYDLFKQKNYQKDADTLTLKHYANQVAKKLNSTKSDIIFSATVNPIAYLECDRPMAFWADGTFANIHNFYPQYSNLPEEVIQDWHQMEKLALQKSKLAIYSSDWAAQSAINDYGADPNRVKVVPFGSNTDSPFNSETIKDVISSRKTDWCKLLFLGVDWIRKGGNIAYEVTEKLNQSGLKTELTIVGCPPMVDSPIPNFLKPLGFINKATQEGQDRIKQLLMESHFLILPTIADCTPIVFAEANSLGIPCLSTTVGGVPTMIRNGINGQLFSPVGNISDYCDYITNLFTNYEDYKNLALSAFHEYESRLNWRVAGLEVKHLLETIL
ncbi:glycosyltransferase family 4 protein [Nostoc sp. XA013]|nr:glycosyltransferase family 4 protein [Nostoc sp. XA013]